MKVTELREFLVGQAKKWLRPDTCDQVLHGDGEAEIRGIAVCWILTLDIARRAAAGGANLVISHEPIFYDGYWLKPGRPGPLARHIAAKRREFDRLGLTVMRLHDTWDRYPKIGIPDAWAAWLGLPSYRRSPKSFFGRSDVPPTTVAALARKILRKTRPLGQRHVEVFWPKEKVASLCIGTGAITDLAAMLAEAPADCYLITNDGSNTWATELHSTDRRIPMIRVDHATAELPGMMKLAEYLAAEFPQIPVKYLPYPTAYEVMM